MPCLKMKLFLNHFKDPKSLKIFTFGKDSKYGPKNKITMSNIKLAVNPYTLLEVH